jgi:hypothetical protein
MDDKGIFVEINSYVKKVEEDLIDNFTSGVDDSHMVDTFSFTSYVSFVTPKKKRSTKGNFFLKH